MPTADNAEFISASVHLKLIVRSNCISAITLDYTVFRQFKMLKNKIKMCLKLNKSKSHMYAFMVG